MNMQKVIYYIQQLYFLCISLLIIWTFFTGMYGWGIFGLLLFGFFVWGLFDLRLKLFLRTICRLPKRSNKILLSFDDGLSEHTGKILDMLKVAQVQAVFFVIGNTAKHYPHILKRMYEEGHLIGTHTQNHSILFTCGSIKYVQKELAESLNAIEEITGKRPEWFRPPFGVSNPVIAYVVNQMGLKTLGWSLRSLDTQMKNSEKLKKRILKKIKARDIILLHDRQNITLDILFDLIEVIRTKGFEFTQIQDLQNIQ